MEFCGLIFAISTVQFYYQLLISLLKLAYHLASSKQDNVHEMRNLMCKMYIFIYFSNSHLNKYITIRHLQRCLSTANRLVNTTQRGF